MSVPSPRAGSSTSRPTWSPGSPPAPNTPDVMRRWSGCWTAPGWTGPSSRWWPRWPARPGCWWSRARPGSGKTSTLIAARAVLEHQGHRLVVVTPTLKAAQVAGRQVGGDACSAAWLVHQYGFRWDADGHWTRTPPSPRPAGVGAAGRRAAGRRGRDARPGHRPGTAHRRRRDRRPDRVHGRPTPAPRRRAGAGCSTTRSAGRHPRTC